MSVKLVVIVRLFIPGTDNLCLLILARDLLIFLIFSKNQLVISLIFFCFCFQFH
jgi:hypothetical protein